MESNRTQTITCQSKNIEFADYDRQSQYLESRISDFVRSENSTHYVKNIYQNEQEIFETAIIKNPLSTEKAISQFGLMLGTFPPMTLFGMFIFQTLRTSDEFWIIPLLSFVNFVCALTGYFSGKIIAKMVTEVEKFNWSKMLLTLPFIGILWGIIAGGSGGIFIFGIGAIFGAIIAALVGGFALPVFTIFHRLLNKGDMIERRQFLPIAFGITAVICSFILGL